GISHLGQPIPGASRRARRVGGHRMSGAPEHAKPTPHAWLPLLGGLAAVATMGIVTVGLVSWWMATRPINLIPITETLVELPGQALPGQSVPLAAVRMSLPARHESATAVWHHYDIEVSLPPVQAVGPLVQAVHSKLGPRQVVV